MKLFLGFIMVSIIGCFAIQGFWVFQAVHPWQAAFWGSIVGLSFAYFIVRESKK